MALRAKYHGWCWVCSGRIRPGDVIVGRSLGLDGVENGWRHLDCIPPRPTQPKQLNLDPDEP